MPGAIVPHETDVNLTNLTSLNYASKSYRRESPLFVGLYGHPERQWICLEQEGQRAGREFLHGLTRRGAVDY
jgi:hypothetical protein